MVVSREYKIILEKRFGAMLYMNESVYCVLCIYDRPRRPPTI